MFGGVNKLVFGVRGNSRASSPKRNPGVCVHSPVVVVFCCCFGWLRWLLSGHS